MITQDDYGLYTGQSSNYPATEWEKLATLAAMRLAYFLCLDELPTDGEGNLPEDLAMLLANFLSLMLAERGSNGQVTSKRVRNFSISYATGDNSKNAFAKISNIYGDIVAKYSACKSGLTVEKTVRSCCHECF